jgi:hypothetical protein
MIGTPGAWCWIYVAKQRSAREKTQSQSDLGPPLALDVVVRVLADDREADQEDVGLRVRQGTQAIVVLLAGGIPQAKIDGLAVHHDVGRVVVEHGRDVLAREGVGGVRDEQA